MQNIVFLCYGLATTALISRNYVQGASYNLKISILIKLGTHVKHQEILEILIKFMFGGRKNSTGTRKTVYSTEMAMCIINKKHSYHLNSFSSFSILLTVRVIKYKFNYSFASLNFLLEQTNSAFMCFHAHV